MFALLKSVFAPVEAPKEDAEAAVRRAAAAILVEAGQSDGEYDADERAMVIAALGRFYDLDPAAAEALERDGAAALEQAVGHFRFTSALKEATTIAERADFLTEVWRVVLADGRRDPHEDAFMRKLAGLLYVPDRESGVARRRAEDD